MQPKNTNRRQFIFNFIPTCALLCLGPNRLLAFVQQAEKKTTQKSKHPFDQKYDQPMTVRQFYSAQYRDFITLAKALEKEMGREKAIAFLKKATSDRLQKIGKMQAKRMKDNSFNAYVDQFRSGYDNLLKIEIVEDTEKAFELKVTECIWAETFRRFKVGDIGFAWVCWGDYAWAEGFNQKIKLIRDKTLMQGHDCCNHRYVWQG